MSKISAIILTKNSEELIADCVDSVSFCDEIIVVDDRSTDRTPDLAKHLGARVFNLSTRSFSEKRNFGLKKARYKWIFYIDDDERVTEELQNSIKEIVSSVKGNFAAYKIQRKNFYLGNHEWPYIGEFSRLFRKKSLQKWYGDIHESVMVDGEIETLDGYLMHYTHQDLSSMVEKTIAWSETESKLHYNSNHPKMKQWRFFRVMLTALYNSYIVQKGYKAGTVGFIESIFQVFSIFITYSRLWEMQQSKAGKNE